MGPPGKDGDAAAPGDFLYFVTRNACISYLRSDRTIQTTEKEWMRMADEEEEGSVLDLERVHSELIQRICTAGKAARWVYFKDVLPGRKEHQGDRYAIECLLALMSPFSV